MDYKLVADSACELPEELREGAASVPLTLQLGERSYRDDAALDVPAFVAAMKAYPGAARSACPSPEEYARAFESDGPVFAVTLSGELSGSCACAHAALGLLDEKAAARVHIFDSRSASAGEILVALRIREAAERGLSRVQIIERVSAHIREMQTLFVLDDVDNLVKNGRMSRLVGRAASALRLRPILGADDGRIVPCGHARGSAQAVEKLAALIGERCRDARDRVLVITHCENEAGAQRLRALAEELHRFRRILVQRTGGLSSLYANRGGIIAAF